MKKENRESAKYNFPLEIMEQKTDHPEIFSLPHWHELVEVIYIRKGELLLQLGESKITLRSGDICVINQYGIHSTRSEGFVRGFILFFLPSLVLTNTGGTEDERFLKEKICGDKSLVVAAADLDTYRKALSALLETYQNFMTKNRGSLLVTRGNLLKFFGLLISDNPLYREVPNSNYLTQRERLDKILAFIEKKGTEAISLAEIAKELNLSTYRFCHVFRELTGLSFSQYLLRYRLHKAEEMLVANARPITEVAMACGFNSINYFNRAFKKITGYTPRGYREKFSSAKTHNV